MGSLTFELSDLSVEGQVSPDSLADLRSQRTDSELRARGMRQAPMNRPRKRTVILGLLAALLLWFVGRPVAYLGWIAWCDERPDRVQEAGFIDDASGLERTRIVEVWRVPETRDAAIEGLRRLLARAAQDDLPVSIAGARHSMGGHSIAEDGIVVDMTSLSALELGAEQKILRAGSGARWSEILEYLDPLGLSVGVMQSNDDFTVGGSVSVNCHGWQHGRSPIASTVRSFRILTADGELLECSRAENAELFRAALGGYGLFGVLVDVDLELVPNEVYEMSATIVDTAKLGASFLAQAADPAVGLSLARVSIRPDELFGESILKVLLRVEDEIPTMPGPEQPGLRRTVFRGSIASDYGKNLRWRLETLFAERLVGQTTRNEQLNSSARIYANTDADGVDVLHEYFVPHAELAAFLEVARPSLEASSCDLLNVTVRDVREDRDTLLRYADTDMFSLVMLFHQPRTDAAEVEMRDLARTLIDAAHELGGRYYLPYRRHASLEQFRRAYPMADEFLAAKRRFDPAGRFRNRFFESYFEPR